MNRIERWVTTSGPLNTRASSITSAAPEPSSLAAAPQPWPSMCPPRMYISSGWVAPILVQNPSSRGPSVAGSASIRRSAVSGWSSGLVLTPVGPRNPLRGSVGRAGGGRGRGALPRGPLAAVAELGEPLDGGLVALQVEPGHQGADRVVGGLRRGRSVGGSGRVLRRGGVRPGGQDGGEGQRNERRRAHTNTPRKGGGRVGTPGKR